MNAFQWSSLICFLIGSSASGQSPVEVSAVLGGEVTFPVLVRDWSEIEEITCVFKGAVIAKVSSGKNYIVRDAHFAGRLRAADESGSIKITNLRTEDSGLYRIEIFTSKKTRTETFTWQKKRTETEIKLYELEIFNSGAAAACTGCVCGYPVRIIACAAAIAICALVGFIV